MWTLRVSGKGSLFILFYHRFKNVLTVHINLELTLFP